MITKTLIKNNSRCIKYSWLEYNNNKVEKNSKKTNVFNMNKNIEDYFKKYFKDVSEVKGLIENQLRKTKEFITKNAENIFKPSFVSNGVYTKADMLVKVSDGLYDIINVKISTKICDEDIEDSIIQFFTIKNTNLLKLNKFYLWIINTNSKNKNDFFIKKDISFLIKNKENEYNRLVLNTKNSINLSNEPNVEIGKQCLSPYECPFKKYCWKNELYNKKSVLNLPHFNKKWEAFNRGIKEVTDPNFIKKYNGYVKKHGLIYKSIINNELVINIEEIKKAFSNIKFPIYFLDFETIISPIVFLKNKKPYNQIIFQYSIHILHEDGKILHHNFFKYPEENYEEKVIDSIIKHIGNRGSVIIYNKRFESNRIKELIFFEKDKKKKKLLISLSKRIIDFLEIVSKNIYHPNFLGSFSLKRIAPVLIKGVRKEKKSGFDVGKMFLKYINSNDLNKKRKLRKELYNYNRSDTLNLLLLYKFLLKKI